MGMIGEVAKLVGMTEQYNAEDRASRQRERELRSDKTVAEFSSADTLVRGVQDAGLVREDGSKQRAAQFVAYSNSGVDATVGTAADVQAYTAATAEHDARTASNNAVRDAWGLRRTAAKLGREADAARDEPQSKTTGRVLGSLGQSSKVVGEGMKLGMAG